MFFGQVSWMITILAAGAVLTYLVARIFHASNRLLAILTAAIFLASLLFAVQPIDLIGSRAPDDALYLVSGMQMLEMHQGALYIASIALAMGCLVSIYCAAYLELDRRYHVFYPLLLLMICGLTGMVFSIDLFTLYLFCELMSVSAYALVAFRKHTDTAVEAGYKYLVMGSTATIAFLFGIALIYGSNGSIDLRDIHVQADLWSQLGIIFLIAGLGLKCAMVPLHTWLPDAHGRAPSSISALLSGIVVQSVFFVMVASCLRLGVSGALLGSLLLIAACANILVGNMMALVQDHTKRMLGYSTIAQMGYIMFCMGAGLRSASILAMRTCFYLILLHAACKGLAFLTKGAYHFYLNATSVHDMRGGSKRLKIIPIAFSFGIVGLSGLPPIAGFTAKWLLLTSLMDKPDRLASVALGVFLLGSVVALGYYLPLIVRQFQPADHATEASVNPIMPSVWMVFPVAIICLLIMAMSLAPQFFLLLGAGAAEDMMRMVVP